MEEKGTSSLQENQIQMNENEELGNTQVPQEGSKGDFSEVTFQQLKLIVNEINDEDPDPAKFFQIRNMAQTLLNRAKRVRRNNQSDARASLDRAMLSSTVMAQKKQKEKIDILQQLKQIGQQKAIEYKAENLQIQNDNEELEALEPAIIKKIQESQLPENLKNDIITKTLQTRKDGAIFHLSKPKRCYCCKQFYNKVHSFYHSMCLECGNFNEAKRNAKKPNLTGKIALVTGGRIKIGFIVSLLLLRSGCEVHVTTRFPKDSLERYKKEADYESFKERIFIYSLDFKNIKSVDTFCEFFKQKIGKLDYLINNAAQCVRREASYFNYLLDIEQKPLKEYSESDLKVLSNDSLLKEFEENLKHQEIQAKNNQILEESILQQQIESEKIDSVAKMAYCHFSDSALMNLQPVLEGKKTEKDHLYPKGIVDSNNIQVDLAEKNSWTSNLEEVPIFEFMEVQIVNAWAPFILCQKLKDCMISTPEHAKENKYIINVSSVEGKFNMNHKPTAHPHNNMSKASLNMLTRTVGPHYQKNYNIFMTCVDTGWVSNEMIPQFFFFKDNIYKNTPIDEIDGSLRVVDPIFEGENGNKPLHSVFLQNYKVTDW